MRPPGVDVPAHVVERLVLVVQVKGDGAAAARCFGLDQRDAEAVEHARCGRIDVGSHRRLHAAVEHQHLPGVAWRRPFDVAFDRLRDFFLQGGGKQRTHGLPDPEQRLEQRGPWQHETQSRPHDGLRQRAADMLVDDVAADIHQPAILHTGRTGGFAGAAGQAAIQVHLRLRGDLVAFEDFLHQVDAAARTVEFVAQQLVSRTGCRAEPAMHARAQDAVGFLAFGGAADEFGQIGFHLDQNLNTEARRVRRTRRRNKPELRPEAQLSNETHRVELRKNILAMALLPHIHIPSVFLRVLCASVLGLGCNR